MRHYSVENNVPVDLEKMKQVGFMPDNEYISANANLILACHDVFIRHSDGILLVKRKTKPAINVWWPLGGRILKGFSNEESLSRRIKSECGLELTNIQEIGCARVILGTDPFGHGKGVDAIAVVFYAEGKGTLNLDKFHFDPLFVTRKTYTKKFRKSLHPYVRDYMDIAITKI
jgi:ADP-ribose pyrophosphatase YjhB (NUDIX family)